MSQYDFGNLESPLSGSVFINTHLEPWRVALHSNHSGTSRPSYAVAGMTWVDTTTNPWVLKIFDGTDDISIGTINTSTNSFVPSNAGVADGDKGDIVVSSSGTVWVIDTGVIQTAMIANNQVTLGKLATQAANTALANATTGAAVPSAVSITEQTVLGRLTGGNITAVAIGTSANNLVQLDGSARLPAVDGSQLTNLPGAGVGADLDNFAIDYDDFFYVANRTPALPADFWTVTLNAGTAVVTDDDAMQAMGFIALGTSTASTNSAAIAKRATFRMGGTIDFTWRAKIPTISDGTNRFTVRVGLANSELDTDAAHGVYFRYADNVNSGNWQCVCRSSSTETVINTSVAGSTSWVKLRATVNAASTSAEFFINGVSQGTTTTNIPTSGQSISPRAAIKKSLGNTARTVLMDYFYMKTQRV